MTVTLNDVAKTLAEAEALASKLPYTPETIAVVARIQKAYAQVEQLGHESIARLDSMLADIRRTIEAVDQL